MASNMKVIVEDVKNNTKYEYYEVPRKVGNAIIDLLDECAEPDSTVMSAVSELLTE